MASDRGLGYKAIDYDTRRHFTFSNENGKKRVRCNYCEEESAENITRMRTHLASAKKCPKTPADIRLEFQKKIKPASTMRQQPISFSGPGIQRQRDAALAHWIYTSGRPFALVDDPGFRAFLQLFDPAYNPPSNRVLSSRLLDESYAQLQKQVNDKIQTTRYLNITCDESTDISKHRILNISFSTRSQSFYYCSMDMGDTRLTSDKLADTIVEQVGEFLASEGGGKVDWKRINSLATDTNHTMFKVHNLLGQRTETAHMFFVPCDSHGLQLLIKDLLLKPPIRDTFNAATAIVCYFDSAALQLGRVRRIQEDVYGKTQSFLAAVMTRWGSQYNMLSSVGRSQKALERWAVDVENEAAGNMASVRASILDPIFWANLNHLADVLQPLHEAQVMSESQRSDLMKVTTRWVKIKEHLDLCSKTSTFREPIRQYLDDPAGWLHRFYRQIKPIHWVAFYLQPSTVLTDPDIPDQMRDMINIWLMRYGGQKAKTQFWYFRTKHGGFFHVAHGGIWSTTDPMDFWVQATSIAPELADLALRVYHTTANSVASERSFSSMNFIHSKTRNRLQPESVNKLVYIQMNHRVVATFDPLDETEKKSIAPGDMEREANERDLFDIEQMERRYLMERTTQPSSDSETEMLDEASQVTSQLMPRGSKRVWEEIAS